MERVVSPAASPDLENILHVVVGASAAGSLIKGLRDGGRDESVTCLQDDLSFAPIDPSSSGARQNWIADHLGLEWAEIAPDADFWDRILSWPDKRVLWLSRRSAREYAGFLEIVRRLDNRPADFIDITDANILCGVRLHPDRAYRATLVSLLQPEAFLRPEVLQMSRPMTEAVRASYLDIWRRLTEENAPLRVIEDLRLVSKPLDYFDPMLMSLVTPRWQRLARVIGGAFSQAANEGHEDVSMFFVEARLRALVEAGRLVGRALDRTWHEAEIRLPGRAADVSIAPDAKG